MAEKKHVIGIYYNNFLWGREFFTNIIKNNVNIEDICYLKNSFNCQECRLKNGNEIRTIRANEHARGYKNTKVFIERGISNEIIDTIIKPSLVPSKHNSEIKILLVIDLDSGDDYYSSF